jgi:hypothetical protein
MALIAGIFGRTLRSARRTPTARQGPLVLSCGDFEATRFAAPKSRVPGHVPHLVSHLVAHHVVPGPIRILPIVLLYMILPHPFCTQWSCRPGDVPDERGPQAESKLRRPYRRAKHGRRASARTVPQCGRHSSAFAHPGNQGHRRSRTTLRRDRPSGDKETIEALPHATSGLCGSCRTAGSLGTCSAGAPKGHEARFQRWVVVSPLQGGNVGDCYSRGFTPGWYVTRLQRWEGGRRGRPSAGLRALSKAPPAPRRNGGRSRRNAETQKRRTSNLQRPTPNVHNGPRSIVPGP